MELTPIYRIEYFLDAIVNGSVCPYEPIYRVEYYLAQLAGADVMIPEPIYRVEFYLAKLCGMDVEIPDPIYRIEFYLAKACGMDVEVPGPIYRVEYWLNEMAGGGTDTYTTFTGSLIQFTAPKAHAFKSFSFTIEPQQSGSGDPSPSNVRPISGWNSATVTGAGKNLLKLTEYTPSGYHRNAGFDMKAMEVGATVTESGNVVTIVNTATSVRGGLFSTDILPSGEYYVYIGTTLDYTNRRASVYICDENYIVTSRVNSYAGSAPTVSCLVTLTESARICVFYGASTADTVNAVDAQVVVGSTASTWESYNGTTTTIPLGSTVYGGNAVWNGDGTWKLTISHASNTIIGTENLGNNGIQAYGGIQVVYTPNPSKAYGSPSTWSDLWCDRFKSAQTTSAGSVTGRSNNGNLYFNMPADVTTVPLAKTWFAENNTQVVFKLATPIEYDLSDVTLFNALKGENNIWTDCGDTTLEAIGEAIELNALQSLNILLGGRYVNNHTADDVSDEEALNIILGGGIIHDILRTD